MNIKTHFGRVLSIPTLIVIFMINYSGLLNLTSAQLDFRVSFSFLLVLVIVVLVLTSQLYKVSNGLILFLFWVSIILFQNLMTAGLHDFLTKKEDYDILNDVSFFVIIPVLLVSTQLWGWIFDRIKNASK